jgi:hypothetical protein
LIVSIHQPNYLPWEGLINKILESDVFIVFDDIQLPRGKNYTTRTKIKTSNGSKWISVPVKNKSELIKIKDVKINNETNWKEEHCNKIFENYKGTKYFEKYFNQIEKTIKQDWEYIHELNIELIKIILNYLNIKTKIVYSSEFNINSIGTKKIIELIKSAEGNEYLTGLGKGSQRYTIGNEEEFEKNGISVKYSTYKETKYQQVNGDFISNLSILDMIFNIGEKETIEKISFKKIGKTK